MPIQTSLKRVSAAALFVLLSMGSPIAVRANDSPSTSRAGDIATIRIDNFARVGPTYYRGAQPEGRDYEDLKALGVKTVINLTSHDADEDERAMTEAAGMTYVQIPMTTHEPPTSAQLAEFLRLVNDPASQPVYVHCVGGRHRTGVMTAVYRMTQENWTGDQAFKEMKQYKYGPDFLHSEFKKFVYGFRPNPELLRASASQPSETTGTITNVSNR